MQRFCDNAREKNLLHTVAQDNTVAAFENNKAT